MRKLNTYRCEANAYPEVSIIITVSHDSKGVKTQIL